MSDWISLKDAVPFFDDDEIPILCFDGILVFAAFYDGQGFFLEDDNIIENYLDGVTHWRYFPKPPEVKE